MSAMLPKILIF